MLPTEFIPIGWFRQVIREHADTGADRQLVKTISDGIGKVHT